MDEANGSSGEREVQTSAADAEEMTAREYVVFFGYIGGFMVFFYAAAALLEAGLVAT